jgi:hypothetical protein
MEDGRDIVVGDTAPCVGCGMCCNGTLYWMAKVTPGEEERISAHGLELTEEKGTTYFRLPCHHEQCGRCTIYETRFDICRSFRCQLLRNYQAGEVGLGEARRRIRASLAEAPDGETVEEKAARALKLLNIIALDTCLERWFRNPKAAPGDAQPEISSANS